MPRGIAAHYTTFATPTSEPTTGLEKRAFGARSGGLNRATGAGSRFPTGAVATGALRQ